MDEWMEVNFVPDEIVNVAKKKVVVPEEIRELVEKIEQKETETETDEEEVEFIVAQEADEQPTEEKKVVKIKRKKPNVTNKKQKNRFEP